MLISSHVCGQELDPGPDSSTSKLVPVHLWAAGKTVALRTSPLTDTRETYVPLTALAAVGADFRLTRDGTAAHINARSGRQGDLPLIQLKGSAMLALSSLAEILDASIETSATESEAKATFKNSDTIYLLARVTEARFENGALHVRTSFPVPTHARMIAEMKPPRGYLDCVGASVSDSFKPSPLHDGERQALRLRTGQNSPTVARIVVELQDGVTLRTGDTKGETTDLTVAAVLKSGAFAESPKSKSPTFATGGPTGTTVASTGKPRQSQGPIRTDSTGPPVPTPADDTIHGEGNPGQEPEGQGDPGAKTQAAAPDPPAKPAKNPATKVVPPTEVRSLSVAADNPNLVRFDVATGSKVRPIVRYTPGTTQMLVDIPNSILKLADGDESERALTHPLIGGVKLETFQGSGSPTTRLTLDTARILGYSLNIQSGFFSLELRMPRNATGVLADKLIVVDAGHGGSATGATGGGICEKNCTLGIAMKLRAELEACGARVVMTRTRDCDVSLTDRSRMGNEIGADFFVSIHNDSNERSNSASGTSTYYHASESSSRALATCIQHSVMAVTGLPSRGVLSDTVMYNSGFAVLRGSSMPAVLCEVAYINNQTDRRKLVDAQFQQRVAKAVCDGLRNYVEGKPKRTVGAFARPMPESPMPAQSSDSAIPDNGR